MPANEPSRERLERLKERTGYARPLAIQMEALLCIASAAPEPDAMSVEVLLRRVLGLERDHWKKLLGTLDESGMRDMNRGVAQLTGVSGVPSAADAEGLLMADRFYQGRRTARVDVEPLVRSLQKVLGRADGPLGAARARPYW